MAGSRMVFEESIIEIDNNKLFIDNEFEGYVYSLASAWDMLEDYFCTSQCTISLKSTGTIMV